MGVTAAIGGICAGIPVFGGCPRSTALRPFSGAIGAELARLPHYWFLLVRNRKMLLKISSVVAIEQADELSCRDVAIKLDAKVSR